MVTPKGSIAALAFIPVWLASSCSQDVTGLGPGVRGDEPPSPEEPRREIQGGAVYLAESALSIPWLVSPDQGETGEARALGPERGQGYGLGEASLHLLAATPDGRTLLVELRTLDQRTRLFALSVEDPGSAPVLVAEPRELLGELAIAPDSKKLAYADADGLHLAALDGSSAEDPLLLVAARPPEEIVRPRFAPATGRIVFELESGADMIRSSIYSAKLDGSEAESPLRLSLPNGGQHRAQAVLEDGRVIFLDRGLSMVPSDGSAPPLALTPEGLWASLVGVVEATDRLVAELRSYSSGGPRRLISVSASGLEPAIDLRDDAEPSTALLSKDGSRLFFVAASAGEPRRFAVFDVPTDRGTAFQEGQITRWLDSKPYLGEPSLDGRSVLACNTEREILRVDRSGSSSSDPVVLAVSEAAPPICPLVGLSGDGAFVLFSGKDFSTRAVPLSGGYSFELSPFQVRQIVEKGAVVLEHEHRLSALFVTDGVEPASITPWFEGAVEEAELVGEGAWVLFAHSDRRGRSWRIAPADGSGEAETLEASDLEALIGESEGRLIFEAEAGRVLSFSLAPGDPRTPVLVLDPGEAGRPLRLLEEVGVLIAFEGPDIVAAGVDGGDAAHPVKVLRAAGGFWDASAIGYDASAGRVIAAVPTAQGYAILGAALDGSEADRPVVIAGPHVGFVHSLVSVEGRVLATLATEDTAVPHPTQVLTLRASGANAEAFRPLAPNGYLLLGTTDAFPPEESHPVITEDGEWALLSGPEGVYGVRTDGSLAEEPTRLVEERFLASEGFAPSSPRVLLRGERRLYTVWPDGSEGDARAIGSELEAPIARAVWVNDGAGVVFLVVPPRGRGVLFLASPEGTGSLFPITDERFGVDGLVAVAPGGQEIVFASTRAGDRSLYLATIRDAPPTALTPIDDAHESFLGFARAWGEEL